MNLKWVFFIFFLFCSGWSSSMNLWSYAKGVYALVASVYVASAGKRYDSSGKGDSTFKVVENYEPLGKVKGNYADSGRKPWTL